MHKKLNNIKIIFLDIDGTLYNSKKQVTDYTEKVLNKAKNKGIDIVLCSGRSNLSVCEISKNINASKYVIVSNGAFVYDYEKDITIFERELEKKNVDEIWELCKSEGIDLILESTKANFVNTREYAKKSKYIKINNIEDISDRKILQMVVDNVEMKKIHIIKELLLNNKQISAPNYGISKSDYEDIDTGWFDINNKNIDKGVGIANLIEYLGLKKEDTIGFGDGVNDVAMFRECGIGVAMGNAKEELKKVADYITLTNDEDGVAKFIEEYIL